MSRKKRFTVIFALILCTAIAAVTVPLSSSSHGQAAAAPEDPLTVRLNDTLTDSMSAFDILEVMDDMIEKYLGQWEIK